MLVAQALDLKGKNGRLNKQKVDTVVATFEKEKKKPTYEEAFERIDEAGFFAVLITLPEESVTSTLGIVHNAVIETNGDVSRMCDQFNIFSAKQDENSKILVGQA
jgi:hypothetical protein